MVEEMTPGNLCQLCVCLLSFLGQWGPAVYLCYKVGLAKANTLVYEAGEWPLRPSKPLVLNIALACCLLAGTLSVPRPHFPVAARPFSGVPDPSPESDRPSSFRSVPTPLCWGRRAAGSLPRGGQRGVPTARVRARLLPAHGSHC